MLKKIALPQSGFTLLELLIAITIFAIISTITYQTFSTFILVKSGVETKTANLNKWQKTWYWISDDFFHAVPRIGTDELGTGFPAMKLTTDNEIYFSRYIPYPTPTAEQGIIRVGYILDQGVLYRLSWLTADLATSSEPTRQKLLTEIQSFEIRLLNKENEWFRYWPTDDGKDNTTSKDLPQVAEITINHKINGSVMRRVPMIKGSGIE